MGSFFVCTYFQKKLVVEVCIIFHVNIFVLVVNFYA